MHGVLRIIDDSLSRISTTFTCPRTTTILYWIEKLPEQEPHIWLIAIGARLFTICLQPWKSLLSQFPEKL